ncbi:TetR family transcriptional regulator [Rhodospirillum rubrum]|uniref:TetR/AcrR family transcriptional regulator n=1 Tax=Rhodospirillum rubrum TaxID=1085 RepID=UPI0019061A9B|nr:TetR/AcrR family transcriptional regulator [Rhodospirillum rubrum]MBK1665799.1 TetR family transcriptional regulator [Rhodospirillum rubrum]MBK1677984.1 TetR family transcriptional regulator [Rhodospirillum rubrum]
MTRWKTTDLDSAALFQRKRDAVIHEAAQAFSRFGYHGTSLDDIARVLNVTKAALYYYVASKQELLAHCHAIGLGICEASLADGRAQATSGLDAIEGFVRAYVGRATDELGVCLLIGDLSCLAPAARAEVMARRDAFEGSLRDLIRAGREDGGIRPDVDPKLSIFQILGALNHIPRWYSPTGPNSPTELAQYFARQIRASLSI